MIWNQINDVWYHITKLYLVNNKKNYKIRLNHFFNKRRPILGAALAPGFRLLNFDFQELGISFKSNTASTKQRDLEQSKQYRKAATRIEKL